MKKRGFTLIELLAVIVILAIIALIATPAVLNIIEDSRKGAAEASARNIVSAAKTYYMSETMNGRTPSSIDLSTNTLKYDGEQATKGVVTFENGKASGKMYINGYCVEVSDTGAVSSSKVDESDCTIESTPAAPKELIIRESSYNGANVWTDGTNTYYSNGSDQYVLNGSTWEEKTWDGIPEFHSWCIWTDGTNYYCSYGSGGHIVLNGNTWEMKTWDGFDDFDGENIWTDGTNIYYSNSIYQYVLNGSTWEEKTWNGLTEFDGENIWTDGTNTYYSYYNDQYVLNGSTWEVKNWTNLTYYKAENVWTDGTNVYYSFYDKQYVLVNNDWEVKIWENVNGEDLAGYTMWTDGQIFYYCDMPR